MTFDHTFVIIVLKHFIQRLPYMFIIVSILETNLISARMTIVLRLIHKAVVSGYMSENTQGFDHTNVQLVG